MRTIKFRAKCLGTGELVYFDLFSLATKDGILYANAIGIDPDTIQLYTGLKDKNGVEGYFDDLIRWGKAVYQVMWNSSKCIGELIKCHGNGVWATLPLDKIRDGEAIGNIYENPELISA